MHPINSQGQGPRELKSHWHCLAINRQRLSGIRQGWCPYQSGVLKGCSVPTLATLTACREVCVYYKPRMAKSSETTPLETPMASAVSTFLHALGRSRQITGCSPLAAARAVQFSAYFTRAIQQNCLSPGSCLVPPQAKPFLPFPGVKMGDFRPSMKYTDIAIIGGGLAGSTAAAMLGRAGICIGLIDPARDLSVRLSRRKIERQCAA